MRLEPITLVAMLVAAAPAFAQPADLPPPAPLGGPPAAPPPAAPPPAAPASLPAPGPSVAGIVAFPALGPLGASVTPGEDGSWTVTAAGAGAVLTNTREDGALRYYYVTPPPGTAKVRVETSVALQPADANAGAGLLYGFDVAAGTYMAVALMPGDTVVIYKRGADGGVGEVMRSSTPGLLKTGANSVVVTGEGNDMKILVNGEEIAGLSDPILSADKGVGIVAIGRGTFTFEAWTAS